MKGEPDAETIGLKDICVGVLAKYVGTINVDALIKFYEKEFIKPWKPIQN